MGDARIKGKSVNKAELAEILGVSVVAIDRWLSRGLPFRQRGSKGVGYEFDTAAVVEWRSNRAVEDAISDRKPTNQEDALKRKLSAEAQLAELRLARELGSLVTVDDAAASWSRLIGAARAKLLAVPSKMAPLVHSAETVDEVRSTIEIAIHEAIEELAGDGISDDSSDESPESAQAPEPPSEPMPERTEAPAKVNGKRVGRSKSKTKSRSKR